MTMAGNRHINLRIAFDETQYRALELRLATLSERAQKRVMKNAVYAGAKIVRDVARALAPVLTGALRRSIAIKSIRLRTKDGAIAIVGPKNQKDAAGRNPGKYAHLVEYGRASVGVKEKKRLSDTAKFYGVRVAAAMKRPFMRPAYDQNGERVIQAMLDRAWKGIAEEAAKRR